MPSIRFSALQRAEIAEIGRGWGNAEQSAPGFSALQRAEIAEIRPQPTRARQPHTVSVLFNEPKLLKCVAARDGDVT